MKPWICSMCSICLLLLLACSPARSQDAPAAAACPAGQPGVYVQDGPGWRLLNQAAPVKVKAKHAFLTGMTYGAVAAPVVAVYSGAAAQVEVHGARPVVCISHIMSTNAPTLIRLERKKNSRELDTGHMRASITGGSHQAVADSGIVVPTTDHTEENVTRLEPQADVMPGEYAVMFGAGNLAILDFGVLPPK